MSDDFTTSPARRPTSWYGRTLWLIVLAGFALRLYRLGAPSIWYDEGVSLFLAGKSLPDMLAHTAGDIHPPLYYALLHLWTGIAGSSEFAAGFFSLFCGLLLIPLIYQLGRRVVSRDAGILAAVLIALSPFHVWYSQELRMYTLGAGLGLLAAIGLWDAVRGDAGSRRGWILYALAAAAGLYALYYFAFLLIALNVWALAAILRKPAASRRRLLRPWGLAQAGALLLYAPWLPTVFRQITNPPVPAWREFTPLGRLIAEGWTALSFGQSVEAGQVWPLLLATAGLVLLGGIWLVRQDWSDGLLVIGYIALPVVLIFLISLVVPLYHVRYLFTYAPAFSLLLAAGLLAVPRRWRSLGTLALLAWIAGCGLSLWQYHYAPAYAGDDHRAAVRYLDEQWRPGDAVLVNAGYVYPPLVYYNRLPVAWRGRLSDYGTAFRREQAPAGLVMLQTGTVDGAPNLGWGSPSSDFYALSRAETAAALERVFGDYERVWVYRCYDTVTDPGGFIRAWLDENGIKFEETPAFAGLSNLRVQGYLTRRGGHAALPAGARPAGDIFDGKLELAATEGAPAALDGGGPIEIVLWWRPTAALPTLAVTLRLSDAGGRVWFQSDARPLGGLYGTDAWPAGQLVRQPARVLVPEGLAPGEYRLLAGVYDAISGGAWSNAAGEQLVTLGSVRAAGQTAAQAPNAPLARFDRRVDLLAARPADPRVQAGLSVPVELLWYAGSAPAEDLTVFAQVLDSRGTPIALQESAPADGRFPTGQWAAGQLVAERRELAIPADTLAGKYALIVGLYRSAGGERLKVGGVWPWARRDYYRIGTLTVTTRIPQRQPPRKLAQPVDAPLGAGVELVSYELETSALRPGGQLGVTLLWRRTGALDGGLKVFCHLVDAGGEIVAQTDGTPAEGRMPTASWMAGEYVLDAHTIALKASVPAGSYRLLVGMYEPASGARPGEPIDLGAVTIYP